jgi:hypothetical protein
VDRHNQSHLDEREQFWCSADGSGYEVADEAAMAYVAARQDLDSVEGLALAKVPEGEGVD